jgi:hypothetical protein
MQVNVSMLERAFELAKSGRYDNLHQLKADLRAEGYITDSITGRQFTKQLGDLIRTARRSRKALSSVTCLVA